MVDEPETDEDQPKVLHDNAAYEIDNFIDHKGTRGSGRAKYLVHWTGYSSKEDSWVAESDLVDKSMADEYWQRLDQQAARSVTQPQEVDGVALIEKKRGQEVENSPMVNSFFGSPTLSKKERKKAEKEKAKREEEEAAKKLEEQARNSNANEEPKHEKAEKDKEGKKVQSSRKRKSTTPLGTCKCGSTMHTRINAKACPLNKLNKVNSLSSIFC